MKNRKIEVAEERTRVPSGEEWLTMVQSEIGRFRKFLRKGGESGDSINALDMTNELARRRQRAILNTMPEIYRRYKAPEKDQPAIGIAWRDLNLCFETYSHLDMDSHILFGAAIWILDQVARKEGFQELYRLLPRDEDLIDNLCNVDVWHAGYEYDLISSIEYVLHHRNPVEIDGQDCPRTLTSEYLARKSEEGRKKQPIAEPDQNRKNYDALIGMIPREAVEAAAGRFRKYFWEWTDRFFSGAEAFLRANAECFTKIREAQIEFIRAKDELSEKIKRIDHLQKQKKRGVRPERVVNPLLVAPERDLTDILKPFGGEGWNALDTNRWLPAKRGEKTENERLLDECDALGKKMERLSRIIEENVDTGHEIGVGLKDYQMQIVRYGRIRDEEGFDFGEINVSPMEPMKISDPYEMCFALLYLIETDDDLPWLYGAGCGLMEEVTEALPWGIEEFDEVGDDVWMGSIPLLKDASLPKSVSIPDWSDRAYRMKGDEFDFPRSFAQIVYEETGCVLPANLHLYDDRARKLGKYGIRGKDAAMLLMMMSVLSTARRSLHALNLETNAAGILDALESEKEATEADGPREETAKKKTGEEPEALREEIRRLKAALHASEKENREAKKTLADLREEAGREHRELADLREYVFNQTENAEEESAEDKIQWPYEVRKDTLVFGGHATWVKGLRSLLTGKVRFIAKDFTFDTGIVKNTETIWIQPNAMSHPMYYRIMDAVRACGKPIRYFAFASWSKCAGQLAENDMA